MTTKRTMKLSILTKRSSTISLLGYQVIDGTSLSQRLCCPHEADWLLTMMGLSTPSSGNGKTYIKKVYREAEGLRLESINPDYDDLFAPYEDEPKIVGHCGRAFFFHLRFKYAI